MASIQLPPLSDCAFLLDLDGTLLDIAPAPDQVVVEPGLPGHLLQLRKLCGDALAIVTGRPVAQIDLLLPGIPFAIAGEHGAARRHGPAEAVHHVDLPELPPHWRPTASDLARQHPGAMLEPKTHGLVVHYRAAPQAGEALQAGLMELLAERPGDYVLMPAKMAWEIRPAGIDKGAAIRALMQQPPFQGRTPIFVGDDVTDQDGIAEARAQGGIGLFVPDDFGSPAGVRAWIASLVTHAA
jgi:trehalose 6-phosphate phosphatase